MERVTRALLLIDVVDFVSAGAAAACALAYHRAIARLEVPLQARAGLHVGEVILSENAAADVARGAKPLELDGLAKPMAARIMSLAIGGQTLLSAPARAALAPLTAGAAVRSQGHYRLKGIAEPMERFELGVPGEAPLSSPPDGATAVTSREVLALPGEHVMHVEPLTTDGAAVDLFAVRARASTGIRVDGVQPRPRRRHRDDAGRTSAGHRAGGSTGGEPVAAADPGALEGPLPAHEHEAGASQTDAWLRGLRSGAAW